MTNRERLVQVGRVGRPHGRDGSFHVEAPSHPLGEGVTLVVAGREATIERRAGTDASPLVRVNGVAGRDAAASLRGEALLVSEREAPLADGEWPTADLVGCRIDGIGHVRRVVAMPTCDVLEVGEDGLLIPFTSDAIRSIDPLAKTIEVDRRFLGLDAVDADPRRAPT